MVTLVERQSRQVMLVRLPDGCGDRDGDRQGVTNGGNTVGDQREDDHHRPVGNAAGPGSVVFGQINSACLNSTDPGGRKLCLSAFLHSGF